VAQARFSVHSDDREAVLAASGEIDISTVDDLRRRLRDAIEAAGEREVVVDLGDVSFIDSSGLEALVLGMQRLAPRRLTLRRPSAAVHRLLEVTGTLDQFVVEQ
jgi:anti-anti-sigma factor